MTPSEKFVLECVKRWLEVRLRERIYVGMKFNYPHSEMVNMAQLVTDIDHSALLRRLMKGYQELREPPVTEGGYPVYPEEELKSHLFDDPQCSPVWMEGKDEESGCKGVEIVSGVKDDRGGDVKGGVGGSGGVSEGFDIFGSQYQGEGDDKKSGEKE